MDLDNRGWHTDESGQKFFLEADGSRWGEDGQLWHTPVPALLEPIDADEVDRQEAERDAANKALRDLANQDPPHYRFLNAAEKSEVAKIERSMRDTKGRDPDGYWNNPQMQARYEALMARTEPAPAAGADGRGQATNSALTDDQNASADAKEQAVVDQAEAIGLDKGSWLSIRDTVEPMLGSSKDVEALADGVRNLTVRSRSYLAYMFQHPQDFGDIADSLRDNHPRQYQELNSWMGNLINTDPSFYRSLCNLFDPKKIFKGHI